MPDRVFATARFFTLTGFLWLAAVAFAVEPAVQKENVVESRTETEEAKAFPSVEEARRQARLLHSTYEATLHVMHRRYFDADEKEVIPARALEDIFDLMDEETGGTTRWIAVNTPAMNVDHEPKTLFEKQAVEMLTAGERDHEAVADGMYHRAGAVTLFGSCLKCHLSALTQQVQNERVAALVVRLPIREE